MPETVVAMPGLDLPAAPPPAPKTTAKDLPGGMEPVFDAGSDASSDEAILAELGEMRRDEQLKGLERRSAKARTGRGEGEAEGEPEAATEGASGAGEAGEGATGATGGAASAEADDVSPEAMRAAERAIEARNRANEERQAERAKIEREVRAQVRGEVEQQLAAERERLRAEVRGEVLKQLREDPVAAVKDVWEDPQKFLTHLAKDGTPEGAHERELMRERAARAELTKRLDAIEAERKAEVARAQSAQQEQARAQAEREFLTEVDGKSDKGAALYPGLAAAAKRLPKQVLWAHAAHEVAAFQRTNGRDPTYAELAHAMNASYALEQTTPATQPTAGTATNGSGKGARPPTQASASARTTTAKDTARMTEEELDALCLEDLREVKRRELADKR